MNYVDSIFASLQALRVNVMRCQDIGNQIVKSLPAHLLCHCTELSESLERLDAFVQCVQVNHVLSCSLTLYIKQTRPFDPTYNILCAVT